MKPAEKYINFIRGVSRDIIGMIGVVLTTSSFIAFIILEIARLLGILTNSYIGLITYMCFPALFIIGLILIPIGWRRLKKKTGQTGISLMEASFGESASRGGFFGSRVFLLIGTLTIVNVVFMAGASMRTLSFMDTPVFCGTACHSVMNPEWVTYQVSPHARVRCVDCHVGEGMEALVDSKLNGMYQIISITFDLLERPIPTPVHQLRPARETCEKCHWPEKFYGSRLKTIVRYEKDKKSTPRYTTLNLKVDAGNNATRRGIHWHISEGNQVKYASVADKREEMIWVDIRQQDGTFKRYNNTRLTAESTETGDIRILDCVDCHNRATHIYENLHDAVNERIRQGKLDRSLPYIKRESLAATKNSYNSYAGADDGIAGHISGFYRLNYPEIARQNADLIDSAISALQDMYRRNIHPYMNITWESYPGHIGHRDGGGCFRCHNPYIIDDSGRRISDDCTLCHSILAYDSQDAFKYLQPADTSDPEYNMHHYLSDEFLKFIKENN